MKKILTILISFFLINNLALAAGGDSGGSSSKASMYDEAVKLIKRAGKLEKKDKKDKAVKLYREAFNKLQTANKKDKNNPDILNYMGFTSRKSGNFNEAEKFYLKGLSLNPKHNGINEYLGELYVQTNRMDKAKEDKANKLYVQAFKKLEKAYKKDKKNPDILNYMGFTSRKTGNFKDAENFYLKGLEIDPKHNGINEYLGELYVQTDRIDKAKERLEVLKNCNCEEYQELELIIKTRGTKIY